MSLKGILEAKGIASEQLDEVVHDAASQLASNANNDGLSAQLEFLIVVCGWSEKQIIEALNE